MLNNNYNPDVLSCLANLSNDEVFTPPKVVNDILDQLPDDLWEDKSVTFLDPVSKSGVFLREIAKRLIVGLEKEMPDQQQRLNHIFKNQLFGVALTELTALLSRRSIYCSKKANGKYSICDEFEDEDGNLKFERIEHNWEKGRCRYCSASEDVYSRGDLLESHAYEFIHIEKPEEIFDMKFDVIIGNPPYQLNDGGNGVSALPLFHLFVQQAKKLNPRFLSMIVPARWYAGGKGLDEFRSEMLSDRRIKKLVDFESSKDCFEGVNIAGGICYFLWSRDYDGDCEVSNYDPHNYSSTKRALNKFPIFIRANRAISIIDKVLGHTDRMMDTTVLPRNPFGFATNERGGNKKFDDSISLISSKGRGYISRGSVTKRADLIDKYKVVIGRLVPSNGELGVDPRDGYRVITGTKLISPGEIVTETYLVIGSFESKEQAYGFNTYINLKFPRFLLRQAISSVNVTRDCFRFVPVLDFSIPWSDKKLYEKFGLNDEESDFVESMIRSVESLI